jgi:hypothetical protein
MTMKLQSVLLALIAGALWIQVMQHYQAPASVFAQSGPSRAPTAQVTTVRLATTPLDVRVVEETTRIIGPQDVKIVGQIVPLEVRLVGQNGLLQVQQPPPVQPPSPRWQYTSSLCGFAKLNSLGSEGWEVAAVFDHADRSIQWNSRTGQGIITLTGGDNLLETKCTAILKRAVFQPF